MTYAPFGYSVFGENLFGQPTSLSISVTLDVTPFDYNALQISWKPLSPTLMSQQILVRSAFGTPTSIYDGTILLNETSNYSGQVIDNDLQSGHFYYYAVFVLLSATAATPQTGTQYLLAGAAQGLVLTDFGFGDTFQSWMPDWYLELDNGLATTARPQGPLTRYLELLGYETDWIRSEIESTFLFTNVEQISGALLPEMGANYGVSYEPELGMTRSRVLVQNAVALYKTKGTAAGWDTLPGGIVGAASAFSGYGTSLRIGINLLIQLDDAAFDRSVGHWVATNATSTITTAAANSFISVTPPHTTWNPMPTDAIPGIQGYLPANNNNVAVIGSNGAIVSLDLTTVATSTSLGIPVQQTGNPFYVASASFSPVPAVSPTLRSFFMVINWYASNGGFISLSSGSPVTEVAGQWVRPFVVATPPIGAAYCGVAIRSSASLGTDLHLLDAVQLEINTQATPGPSVWQPPRDIQIALDPVRQNLLTNPVGTNGATSPWLVSGSSTLAISTAGVAWPANTGRGFLLTPSGSVWSIQNSGIPVTPGVSYSLSWYQCPVTPAQAQTFSGGITFLDVHGTVLHGGVTGYFQEATNGSFVRGSLLNQVAPNNAATATVTIQSSSAITGQAHYIGAPLFAPEGALLPYFDATFLPVTDYIFEGTANQSISDYYPSLPARISRLATVLPDYTPIGSTFSLFVLAFEPGNTPVIPRPTNNFFDWDDALDTWDNATDTWDN